MTVNTDAPAYMVNGVLTDGEAWVALGTTTLSSGAVNIGFTSTTGANDWSQYMDLVLVSSLRSDESADASYMRIMVNSASVVTGGYYDQYMDSSTNGLAGTLTANKNTSTIQGIAGTMPADNQTANIFGTAVTTISDINSGKNKQMFTKMSSDSANATSTPAGHLSIWGTTVNTQAPITSVYVSLYPTGSDEIVANSRVDLFGVLPRMVS